MTLLGAPLFLDKTWNKCCEELAALSDRLTAINSQDVLILLRSCFSAPKILPLLRCSVSVAHVSIGQFLNLLQYLDIQPILVLLTFSGLSLSAYRSQTCIIV